MELQLNETELRVLGSLVEKESTTPDYYPLSLNALTNACNQRSNREPVMSLDEEDVRDALDSLADKRLVRQATSFDSRSPNTRISLQRFLTLIAGRPPCFACSCCAEPRHRANFAAEPTGCTTSTILPRSNPP